MANYLDANPDEAEQVESQRTFGSLVPVARDGRLLAFVNPRSLKVFAPGPDITPEDYIVGHELLGYRFHVVRDGADRLRLMTDLPREICPNGWSDHALAIQRAFLIQGDDARRAIDFLLARYGEAVFS